MALKGMFKKIFSNETNTEEIIIEKENIKNLISSISNSQIKFKEDYEIIVNELQHDLDFFKIFADENNNRSKRYGELLKLYDELETELNFVKSHKLKYAFYENILEQIIENLKELFKNNKVGLILTNNEKKILDSIQHKEYVDISKLEIELKNITRAFSKSITGIEIFKNQEKDIDKFKEKSEEIANKWIKIPGKFQEVGEVLNNKTRIISDSLKEFKENADNYEENKPNESINNYLNKLLLTLKENSNKIENHFKRIEKFIGYNKNKSIYEEKNPVNKIKLNLILELRENFKKLNRIIEFIFNDKHSEDDLINYTSSKIMPKFVKLQNILGYNKEDLIKDIFNKEEEKEWQTILSKISDNQKELSKLYLKGYNLITSSLVLLKNIQGSETQLKLSIARLISYFKSDDVWDLLDDYNKISLNKYIK